MVNGNHRPAFSKMSHQSRGKSLKSCMRVMTGSGDRGSFWAAAVIVDGFYATCPWEMLVARKFNQPLSQRRMCIPIALVPLRSWSWSDRL